jgi:hypothetical protein
MFGLGCIAVVEKFGGSFYRFASTRTVWRMTIMIAVSKYGFFLNGDQYRNKQDTEADRVRVGGSLFLSFNLTCLWCGEYDDQWKFCRE